MSAPKEDVDWLKGKARSVYYNGDGTFTSSSQGCGCCSDTIYNLSQGQAIAVAQSMVEYWQDKVRQLESVSEEKIASDLAED